MDLDVGQIPKYMSEDRKRYLGIGHLKVFTHIRRWRKKDVGLIN